MIPGFLFRFKILPYLQQTVLPKYLEILQNQNFVLVLNDEEECCLKEFSNFILQIFGKYFDISKEMNIHNFLPFFEMLEKIIHLFSPIMNKLFVSEHEKTKILSVFDKNTQSYVLPILS